MPPEEVATQARSVSVAVGEAGGRVAPVEHLPTYRAGHGQALSGPSGFCRTWVRDGDADDAARSANTVAK